MVANNGIAAIVNQVYKLANRCTLRPCALWYAKTAIAAMPSERGCGSAGRITACVQLIGSSSGSSEILPEGDAKAGSNVRRWAEEYGRLR
jgi:hypothetical protein